MNPEPLVFRTGGTVVLETDFCGDVDDVAALALLCGEAKRHPGSFRIGGVSCNVGSPFTVPAVKAFILMPVAMGMPKYIMNTCTRIGTPRNMDV